MLVVEGISGAGKTTLAEALNVMHHLEMVHIGPPGEGGSFPEMMHMWWPPRLGNDRVVFDRGHLGELVYAPIRRGTTLTPGSLHLLEAVLIARDAQLVWLDTDPTVCHWRRSDLELEDLRRDRHLFQRAVQNSSLVWRRFSGVDETVTYFNESGPWQSTEKSIDEEGVGARRGSCNILILGEQISPRAWHPAPFATYCGLDMVWPVINPRYMRVSNVLEMDENLEEARVGRLMPISLHDRWKSLGRPKVVALGSVAMTMCRNVEVPVAGTLPHPQYVRRFHNDQSMLWTRRLAEILNDLTDRRWDEGDDRREKR